MGWHHELSGDPADRYRFKVPTLRNIALTAPYFHDGRARDLDAVLDFYARGRAEVDLHLPGFELAAEERVALLAFLSALTDQPEPTVRFEFDRVGHNPEE